MTPHYLRRQAFLWVGLTLALTACQPRNPLTESVSDSSFTNQPSTEWLEDARVAYGMRMDVETYSYRIIEKYGQDGVKAFADIAAAPQLYRRLIESRVLQDGTYELITTQLKPNAWTNCPSRTKPGPNRDRTVRWCRTTASRSTTGEVT